MPEPTTIEGEVVEEEVERLPAVRAHEAMIARGEITVQELVAQASKITDLMQAAMTDGVHYGKIPGIQKPTLLKPGAEKLCVLLRLAPSYKSDKTFHDGGHLTVVSACTLTHIPTGLIVAEGEGLCSTHESKYAWRQGKRVCPDCGADAIVRSSRKNAYFCISAEGGCGNRYAFGTDKARELDDQDTSKVENPDLPDQWNTVLKMADKRALVAAVLNGTAASDVFTQDAEDSATGSAATESGDAGAEQPSGVPAAVAEISRENEKREFDPGRDFLEGAIRPSDDMAPRLGELMRHLEPGLDWNAMIRSVWEGDRTPEFWIRLSNCLEWISKISGPGDFPPASHEHITAGFAWAFEGKIVEITELPPSNAALTPEQQEATKAAEAADDQIGFGDEAAT